MLNNYELNILQLTNKYYIPKITLNDELVYNNYDTWKYFWTKYISKILPENINCDKIRSMFFVAYGFYSFSIFDIEGMMDARDPVSYVKNRIDSGTFFSGYTHIKNLKEYNNGEILKNIKNYDILIQNTKCIKHMEEKIKNKKHLTKTDMKKVVILDQPTSNSRTLLYNLCNLCNGRFPKKDILTLLSHGANINHVDICRDTALYITVENGYDSHIIQFLIDNGADINIQSQKIYNSCKIRRPWILKTLIENGFTI